MPQAGSPQRASPTYRFMTRRTPKPLLIDRVCRSELARKSARPSLHVGYASLRVSPDDLVPLASSIAVESDSGWRLHGQSDPSGRTVFYTCRSVDRAPGIAFVLRRLEARTGGANPSDPRRSRETPDLVSGRSLQPCPLLIQPPDQRERFHSDESWPFNPRSHDACDTSTPFLRLEPPSSF